MYIKEIRHNLNQLVSGQFLVKKKELKMTKSDKSYLSLILADKTGSLEGKIWPDRAAELDRLFEVGDVVQIEAKAEAFKDTPQMIIQSVTKISSDSIQWEHFIRMVDNPDQIYEKIKTLFDAVSDPWMRKLIDAFLNDISFVEHFKKAPGAKSWHNAYVGGLLEHTYEVMVMANYFCSLYPQVERDSVLVGAFLHDIGKVYELDMTTFEYTIEGGLIGHITIGTQMLAEKIARIEGFPQPLRIKLMHIILSHHGEYEQQSPVLPKTIEATIVYHVDELVSQANAIQELTAAQTSEERVWSDFVGIKNRKYLLKKNWS